MKKLIFLLLVLGMLTTNHAFAKKLRVGVIIGAGGSANSFFQMINRGVGKARKELKIKPYIERAQALAGETIDQKSVDAALERLIVKRKVDIIVIDWMNTGFGGSVKKLGKKHPNVKWIVEDTDANLGMKNVVSVLFGQHEGSFLAGALAGAITKSNKVGFIGGVNIPVIDSFKVGFEEGVKYTNSSANVETTYLSLLPKFTGFGDPKKAFKTATSWYDSGVDIIYSAAGASGNGVIRAARQSKKYAIGVDSDQDSKAKGRILTSMMKRLDNATFNEIKKIKEGNFKPGVAYYGLKEGGVSLTDMKYTKNVISGDVLAKIKEIESKIKSGEIKVTNAMTKK